MRQRVAKWEEYIKRIAEEKSNVMQCTKKFEEDSKNKIKIMCDMCGTSNHLARVTHSSQTQKKNKTLSPATRNAKCVCWLDLERV